MRHFSQTLLLALSALAVNAFQVVVPPTASTRSATSLCASAQDAEKSLQGRRQAVATMFGAASLAFSTQTVMALDMDAFMNQELESDTKNCDPKKDPKCAPQLSADEALCKYGQSGEARGEACKRVKLAGGDLPSAKPQGKSLGGAYAM
mmetsp:Transcript_22544/g.62653  ORF Transcript_22544/g.62653 Transcript_22544/m.62653 type:complete len:149 (+) Transcript_22544:149-595(+)|eukprot:CAMPEP_0168775666 /NCGR_PEP_ID=MMETSP0725-20121227/5631_1 /TAXON_ID=265536 /ORGANISM="Amphiprora sp., Strain CCMP467" /LENGTH=148 /DNA_ID=CAMNT_0008825305 /DNA_START=20 /DNA_END=466 /DNA_ORIENTATION=+